MIMALEPDSSGKRASNRYTFGILSSSQCFRLQLFAPPDCPLLCQNARFAACLAQCCRREPPMVDITMRIRT